MGKHLGRARVAAAFVLLAAMAIFDVGVGQSAQAASMADAAKPAVAALAAVGAASKGGTGNAVVELTGATDCQDIVFLGLRGSGETSKNGKWGMGDPVSAVYSSFLTSMKNRRIAAAGVDYPSAAVPVWQTIVGVPGPSAWSSYFASIDTGVTKTRAILSDRSPRCPDERYVLVGYSQGAMVIHRLVFDLSRAPLGSPLDEILPKIAAVATVGDGDRVAFDDVVLLGSSPAEGQDFGVGLAGMASGGAYVSTELHMSTVGQGLNSRWFQVCDYGDLVCDYGRALTAGPWPTDLIAGAKFGYTVHTKNYTDKNIAITEAGLQTALQAMTANPLHVSFAGSTTTVVGAPYAGAFLRDGGYALMSLELTSGSIPPGLEFHGLSGISGTPTTTGTWTFGYRAVDRVGQTFEGSVTITVSEAAVGEITIGLSGAGCKLPGNSNGTYKGSAFVVSINNISSIPVTIQITSITLDGVSLGDTALVDLVPPVPEVDPNPLVLAPNQNVADAALLTENAPNSQNGTLTITYTVNGGTPISVSASVNSLPPIEGPSCTAFDVVDKAKLALITGIPL